MGKQTNNPYKKKLVMRGLCHSPSDVAICSSDVLRSVIIPRPGPAHAKYSRLGEPSSPQGIHPHQLHLRTRPSSNHVFQVVVLRVSIHCQGCAGKVKKHLSKMEGVTSYSIDLETKRVTVMGHITPDGVLESLSKVKRAELWVC